MTSVSRLPFLLAKVLSEEKLAGSFQSFPKSFPKGVVCLFDSCCRDALSLGCREHLLFRSLTRGPDSGEDTLFSRGPPLN